MMTLKAFNQTWIRVLCVAITLEVLLLVNQAHKTKLGSTALYACELTILCSLVSKWTQQSLRDDLVNQLKQIHWSEESEKSKRLKSLRAELETVQGQISEQTHTIEVLTAELERTQAQTTAQESQRNVALTHQVSALTTERNQLVSELHRLKAEHESQLLEVQASNDDLVNTLTSDYNRKLSAVKHHAYEFGIATRAVIVDLIQDKLKNHQVINTQTHQIAQQSSVTSQAIESYKSIHAQHREALEVMSDMEHDHKETVHALKLQVRELTTELRIAKKSRRFTDDE